MPTAARPMTSQPMTGDATRMRTTTTMTTARTVKMTTMGIGLMSVMEVFSAVHPHPLFFHLLVICNYSLGDMTMMMTTPAPSPPPPPHSENSKCEVGTENVEETENAEG